MGGWLVEARSSQGSVGEAAHGDKRRWDDAIAARNESLRSQDAGECKIEAERGGRSRTEGAKRKSRQRKQAETARASVSTKHQAEWRGRAISS